jgi:glycosyltransferase involved in cell wall biosynthesis
MSTMGPTRNVLNLARALEEWADVTVAFRRLADEKPPEGLRVLEICPADDAATVDDAATTGMSYGGFFDYLKRLNRFVDRELPRFDLILEKSWLLSGHVAARCGRSGQPALAVENIVQNAAHAARRNPMKLLRMKAGGWLAGRNLRRIPGVIAETEFLKREIERFHRVPAQRIKVVELGVDHGIFHPLDQGAARAQLGIDPWRCVLGYVGVLDLTHNLAPVIECLGRLKRNDVELHVTGDGERREEYAQLAAASGARVIFHGKVPHHKVPAYIAAADLCLAPYDAVAFISGELGYSTMKIPEYLSSGRPVVSVPSGRIRSLITEGKNGFLFENSTQQWNQFLGSLPDRSVLAKMGQAAAGVAIPSWRDTALAYWNCCEPLLKQSGKRA